ncbi:MAG: PTS system mannose/fructose/sorbose family transporter subunit IID [Bacillota bacterium]|nr:PTS system mannose/fructose/sorbose family transporter subunit IID [Bacillota bacterium]
MTTRSDSIAINPAVEKITKKDLMKVFWRAFMLPCFMSMDRMQASGFAYAMIPIIKKLYKSKDKVSESCLRHFEVFNTTYAVAPFIMGIATAMEEQAAKDETFDVSMINTVKVALMGPLAGIGDTFFWGTFRIIAAGIGTSLALQGNVLGPILFLVLYNIPHFAVRYFGLMIGYKTGTQSLEKLISTGLITKASKVASVMGLTVIGGMIASMVKLEIAAVFQSGQTTLKIQDVLNQVCPCLLPLAATFFIYYLLKKGVKPGYIMLGVLAFGIAGKFLKIL